MIMSLANRSSAAVLAALVSPLALAQVPPSVPAPAANGAASLNQVVEHTLLTNPEIQSRYQEFRAAMEGQNVARGGLRPQVNAQGFYGKEWRTHREDGNDHNWTRPGYNLELRQLLFDGFRTSNDVKQAGYDKLARFFDLLSTSDDNALAATQAYIDLQRYRELESLAQQNYALHEDTLKQIQDRARSGVGRGVDLEQAGGRLALAQTNLMTESANLNDVQQRYVRITNLAPAATLAPVPDVTDKIPARPTDFNDSLRLNPSVLSKQASLLAANAGIASAKGAFSPVFELVAATGRDRPDVTPDVRDAQSSSVSLQMSYNLYRGGADSARVRQTSAQAYAARDLRDYTCRNVQQDVAIAWNNIVNLRAQLPFLRDHEISTTKVRDAYRQQFQIGQRTLLDLLDTENELFEARRALTNARYDLTVAQYRWLALSHRLMPSLGLSAADGDLPDESKDLQLTDEIIQLCNSTVPDAARLAPVSVKYNDGTLPPTLTPATPAAKPGKS